MNLLRQVRAWWANSRPGRTIVSRSVLCDDLGVSQFDWLGDRETQERLAWDEIAAVFAYKWDCYSRSASRAARRQTNGFSAWPCQPSRQIGQSYTEDSLTKPSAVLRSVASLDLPVFRAIHNLVDGLAGGRVAGFDEGHVAHPGTLVVFRDSLWRGLFSANHVITHVSMITALA